MSVSAISLDDQRPSISNYDKMSKFEQTLTNVTTGNIVVGLSSLSSSTSSSPLKIGLLSGPASPMSSNDEVIRTSTIITSTSSNLINSHRSGYAPSHHQHYHHHHYNHTQQQQQMAKTPKTSSTSNQQLENAPIAISKSSIPTTAIQIVKIITPPVQSILTTTTTTSANLFEQQDISDETKTTASATLAADEAHQRKLLEGEIDQLKAERNFLHQQLADAQRREKILMRRLANKEQEFQDYLSQIAAYKEAQVPSVLALRSALLDPAVNILFDKLKRELKSTKAKLEETQNELAAWKFTPDSNTGKRLMAKCRLLYQENEELGKMTSNGRLAKLETELAMQKSFSEEVKKSQSELEDFLQELDEDVEGMQSTILFLQQELKAKRTRIEILEKENYQLRTGIKFNANQAHLDEQQQQMRKNKSVKLENIDGDEKDSSLPLEGHENENSNGQMNDDLSYNNSANNVIIKSLPSIAHDGSNLLQNHAVGVAADKFITKECKSGEKAFICPLSKKNNNNHNNIVYNVVEDNVQEKPLLLTTTKSEATSTIPATSLISMQTSPLPSPTNMYDVMQKEVSMSDVIMGGKLRTVASRKRNYDGNNIYDNVVSSGSVGNLNQTINIGPTMTSSPRILPPKKSKLRVPPISRSTIPTINEYDLLTTATLISGGMGTGTNITTTGDILNSNHLNHNSNHELEMITTHETFEGENLNLHHNQQQQQPINDGAVSQRIITRRRSVRLNGIAPNGTDTI